MALLTSKELLERSGLSRATLNNYIALNILPKPLVKTVAPADKHGARRIGYFPESSLARIQEVQQLKDDGLTLSQISAKFSEKISEKISGNDEELHESHESVETDRPNPFLTSASVLVATIQGMKTLFSEWPPEDVFQLFSDIFSEMDTVAKAFSGHTVSVVSEGSQERICYCFLPDPEERHNRICGESPTPPTMKVEKRDFHGNHTEAAIQCAFEWQNKMEHIDFLFRKNKKESIHLNVGLSSGMTWFGSINTPTRSSTMVFGTPVEQAVSLSKNGSCDGAILAAKEIVSTLNPTMRKQYKYGVYDKLDTSGLFILNRYTWFPDAEHPPVLATQLIPAAVES